MSRTPRILIQLDPDPHSSVFDAIVAVDSGVDHLLQYRNVAVDQVRDLVHGAMFTRGSDDLHSTALFIGGSDVAAGEALLQAVTACFFGPMRVSIMLDANGANTTAAAAVLAAARHVDLNGAVATVLAATGPVGRRVVRLLAREKASVRVASRSLQRAQAVCESITPHVADASFAAHSSATADETRKALDGATVVIAAGAAGVQLLAADVRRQCQSLAVAIDLNAVPPAGIEQIELTDKATQRDGVACYGAIEVGGAKMKIHKAAIAQLFQSNDQVLDAEEIFALGKKIFANTS